MSPEDYPNELHRFPQYYEQDCDDNCNHLQRPDTIDEKPGHAFLELFDPCVHLLENAVLRAKGRADEVNQARLRGGVNSPNRVDEDCWLGKAAEIAVERFFMERGIHCRLATREDDLRGGVDIIADHPKLGRVTLQIKGRAQAEKVGYRNLHCIASNGSSDAAQYMVLAVRLFGWGFRDPDWRFRLVGILPMDVFRAKAERRVYRDRDGRPRSAPVNSVLRIQMTNLEYFVNAVSAKDFSALSKCSPIWRRYPVKSDYLEIIYEDYGGD